MDIKYTHNMDYGNSMPNHLNCMEDRQQILHDKGR